MLEIIKENIMDIKAQKFEQALRILKALGAKYVVVDANQEVHKHGDLELAEPENKKATRRREHPRGTYVEIVKKQNIHTLQVGDVLTLDPQNYRAESVRSTAINLATEMWGKNAVTTSVNKGKVEVLRIS